MFDRGPRTYYRDLDAQASSDAARAARAAAGLSMARLATALVGAAALVARISSGITFATPIAAGAGLAFIGALAAHLAVSRRAEWHRARAAYARDQIARLDRRWAALPPPPSGRADPPHQTELGVFGRASLEHLVDTTATSLGRSRLGDWLAAPAPHDELPARQAAVADLANRHEFRAALAALGRLMSADRVDAPDLFSTWAGEPSWLLRRPLDVWAPRLITLTLVVAPFWTGLPGAGPLWTVAFVAGWTLTAARRRRIHDSFAAADALAPGYRQLVELLAHAPIASPLGVDLQRRLADASGGASIALRRLGYLVSLTELHHAPLPYLVVQSLTLWDLHVWWALERWRARYGPHVSAWLDAVARLDALSALATVAADHPDWTFAEVDPSASTLDASALGHPLLPPSTCVGNDLRVGPAGSVLVVTGSNMSGKSTLLRAVGQNAILAQAGAPACASRLRLPVVRVETSLHVADSLVDGVSYFLAALKRLQGLVAAARVPDAPDAPRVLYLVDEILQGTNSRERHLAARHVLRHLLASPAIGILTTHDIGLTTTPECQAAGRLVHFTELLRQEGGHEVMAFDYRLREGPATSTNALLLVEQLGLVWPEGLEAPVVRYPTPSRSRS
ncbi:MAG: hypothetical protein U0Q12_22580 [Vicinamibacterales bacterium]